MSKKIVVECPKGERPEGSDAGFWEGADMEPYNVEEIVREFEAEVAAAEAEPVSNTPKKVNAPS